MIEDDGGKALAVYREPYGGRWLVLAALPIGVVEPTPYQRNLSDTHVRKLETVIGKIGRFLDPIVAVPSGDLYWTPNGRHRLEARAYDGSRYSALADLEFVVNPNDIKAIAVASSPL